ncbi:helix-turn-helix domain-containing protein [Paenibacillus endoradicis]|uniref:helix-turn-helix domain-containing protein n=1 Tax=Paenibacillus endoradicis TaxID=2972487 RepID=UPI0021592439|nr:helix-turn-helix transcriptional regulator [Paenibacillus endoradicis]
MELYHVFFLIGIILIILALIKVVTKTKRYETPYYSESKPAPTHAPKQREESVVIKLKINSIRKPISYKSYYTDRELLSIALNIEYARKDRNISQQQLSDCLGYKSTSFISRLETSQAEKISHEKVINIAKCLDVDPSEILSELEHFSS